MPGGVGAGSPGLGCCRSGDKRLDGGRQRVGRAAAGAAQQRPFAGADRAIHQPAGAAAGRALQPQPAAGLAAKAVGAHPAAVTPGTEQARALRGGEWQQVGVAGRPAVGRAGPARGRCRRRERRRGQRGRLPGT